MKNKNFSRKDFLKTMGTASVAGLYALVRQSFKPKLANLQNKSNILIILLDALSAKHVSLYGYPRETMPNLENFAQKATVFHRHYSSANFTNPSTGSLLTGTYPWTHRAFNHDSVMLPEFGDKNIFSMLTPSHITHSFTQNIRADFIISQCNIWINQHLPTQTNSLLNERIATSNNDILLSYWGERIVRGELSYYKPAFYLSTLIDLVQEKLLNNRTTAHINKYPDNLPNNKTGVTFLLSDTFEWLQKQIELFPTPFFSYIHLFPPHDPYFPSADFLNLFQGGWFPISKPRTEFSSNLDEQIINEQRLMYDQFIADVDMNLGKLLDEINQSESLQNTTIIITSDHGEMFERGILGHSTQVLYEPLIHIPLIIHKPGQIKREDVYTPTSIIDILPTICHIIRQPIPAWAEGEILPTFTDAHTDPQRPIFSLEAKENSKFKALTIGTMAMIKWPYKLIHYFGYEELPEGWELYNLEQDPEEMDDLYLKIPEIAAPLQEELLAKLDEANQPYRS